MSSSIKASAVVLVTAFALGGCANMTRGERNTAVGAAAGGVAGNVLTGGSVIGTIGGAAAGGVIGSQVQKDR